MNKQGNSIFLVTYFYNKKENNKKYYNLLMVNIKSKNCIMLK